MLFLDDFTNYLWVIPLKYKSQVYDTFLAFHAYVNTQFERPIKSFQCDNGREFNNGSFHDFCTKHGMNFRFSCPNTSSQNGKAERMIRTINNRTRTLLLHASIPPLLWVYALRVSCYLHNIIPSNLLNKASPFHILYRKVPLYSHLRVFGCLCFPNLTSTTKHKLSPRSVPCVFLGYPTNHRGYLCLDFTTNKFIISRHVTFVESEFPFVKVPYLSSTSYNFLGSSEISPLITHHLATSNAQAPVAPSRPSVTSPNKSNTSLSHSSFESVPSNQPTSPLPTPGQNHPQHTFKHVYTRRAVITSPTHTIQPSHSHPPPGMTTRSQHGIFKPKHQFNLNSITTSTHVPRSHIQALKDPNWFAAMQAEINAMHSSGAWKLVPRPPGAHVINSLWLFRNKFDKHGNFERHKARLVVNGKHQQVGIDCFETFSPVVKPATIRTVLSLAVSRSWTIHQLDVKNAFLHGDLHDTVYMYQPPGFVDVRFPNHVCLLQRSIYGLRQAPRDWYHRLATFLKKIGFVNSVQDNSLFVYRQDNELAYLLLYVDDIVLTTSSDALRVSIISSLKAEFPMTDLGPLTYFLGIAVQRHSKGLFLCQKKYAEAIIERAGMTTCNSVSTPVDTKAKLSAYAGELAEDPTLYRSLAGALQYLTFTRPDISYAVQQICLYMHAPRQPHFNALKRIIRYIQGTVDYGIHLSSTPVTSLIAYTDADWGGCSDTRRSTSGYCVFLGDNLVSWSSKRQAVLSRSSAEAEYRGVANVVAESCWIRNLLLELHCPIRKATVVYCDNVSAVYLSSNPIQHQRTKHVEMDIHFVREKVALGQVQVLHVPSSYQYADIFTKGLPRHMFLDFRSSLTVHPPPAHTAGVC